MTSETVHRLRAAGCVFAEDEAAVLTEAADDAATLDAMVERRVAGEPLEQVVGYADFHGVRVRLRPGVFVPRLRSELLVRIATQNATNDSIVVDLCCGSGALGMAVRHILPDITLHAADLDPIAVACAAENLDGENVHQGDLYDALPTHLRGHVDVLIANVPYVATRHIAFLPAEARDHEPHTALDGGDDGLAIFRAVAERAREWLAPGGVLLSEITEAQSAAAIAIADGNGLTATVASDDDLDAYAIIARPVPAR
ncbi:release factor glutamine methyltransferase [Actinoplanes lutulentus]|uniref:peptide chain release factor N(5)-glutamine methyltransferase n=1 Tax=Actinoplanes lutulentus TaxID=1287878 RepID=A0A327ZH00_9ACTN|nr:putative protein N(5)-glutamine methyltransferase [Actinoplanes lutulentus]MBB2942036.1 release factor glutamine methyltransferase [Actinoplanes lutulentus]RAK39948.1 release factor glutamine methyltransferase [Actinoplanes lutulentus]